MPEKGCRSLDQTLPRSGLGQIARQSQGADLTRHPRRPFGIAGNDNHAHAFALAQHRQPQQADVQAALDEVAVLLDRARTAGIPVIHIQHDDGPGSLYDIEGQSGAIVDSVAKVSEVATPDVPATSHPIPLVNVYRDDVPGVTLTTEQALAGAPEHDGSRFLVSALLGEEQ